MTKPGRKNALPTEDDSSHMMRGSQHDPFDKMVCCRTCSNRPEFGHGAMLETGTAYGACASKTSTISRVGQVGRSDPCNGEVASPMLLFPSLKPMQVTATGLGR